jgi:hypothetical protein
MTGMSALLLGFGLGLKHATDADHVAVVSTLIQRHPGALRAAQIAALWGAGHTATFLAIGVLILSAGLRVSPDFEKFTALAVAVMLIGFGIWHLVRTLRAQEPADSSVVSTSAYARPVLVGIIHGLAGSAGIALLATTTIPSKLLALAYLVLFGAGTVLGMILLTLLISWPMAWTLRRALGVHRTVSLVAAALNIFLGVLFIIEALT